MHAILHPPLPTMPHPTLDAILHGTMLLFNVVAGIDNLVRPVSQFCKTPQQVCVNQQPSQVSQWPTKAS